MHSKIYGFQGLNHQIIEESWDVTPVTEDEGTDGKWKIVQYSGRSETATEGNVSLADIRSLCSCIWSEKTKTPCVMMKASGRSPPDYNLDPKTSFSGWVTRELCRHQVFNISSLCSSSFFFCIRDTLYVNFTGMRPWRNQEQSPVVVWRENYINVPLTHSRVVRCDHEAQQGRGFSYLSYSKLAAIPLRVGKTTQSGNWLSLMFHNNTASLQIEK